jgi:hypothetical protein
MMSERKVIHAGGCQCGAVRYALYAEPANASICHCRMCQKAFGSFYAPLAGVSMGDFAITRGALSIFKSSDVVERGFCKDCGTPLTFRYVKGHDADSLPDEIDVSIGSLDEPARVRPTIQYGIESRLAWIDDLASLPGKETGSSSNSALLAEIAASNHQNPDHD